MSGETLGGVLDVKASGIPQNKLIGSGAGVPGGFDAGGGDQGTEPRNSGVCGGPGKVLGGVGGGSFSLSPVQALKRKLRANETLDPSESENPLANALYRETCRPQERAYLPKFFSGDRDIVDECLPIRLVGKSKIDALLNPRHSYFDSRQGDIVEWKLYQCQESSKPVFSYPRLSIITPRDNPYKLSVKTSHTAMKSLRDLRDTLIEHNVRDAKLMDFTFTLPGEITDWLMQQN
ncbi:unnamed protein product, partial [marine sediment metagenome]